ncbi:MAG: OmpA family protein [Fibrobacteria bacterium]|nr:OmpA family protein [Fibrobacteria bacterium]
MKSSHVLALALAAAPFASAGGTSSSPTLAGKWGLGVDGGLTGMRSDFGDVADLTGRGFLRWHPTEWMGLRLQGGDAFLARDGRTLSLQDAGGDLMLQTWVGRFRPYISGGVLFSRVRAAGNGAFLPAPDYSELAWSLPGEIGFDILVAQNVALTASASMRIWSDGNDYWDGIQTGTGPDLVRRDHLGRVAAGLVFFVDPASDADHDGVSDRFDRCPSTPEGATVQPDGCPVDSDVDGIPDFLDRCPATASGIVVDVQGCPQDKDGDKVPDHMDRCPATGKNISVDANGCPLDADGDGVADHMDRCPSTPKGAPVDTVGCPLDSDHDGVIDFTDKCPSTHAGVKVDATGCGTDDDLDGVPNTTDRCPNTASGISVDATGCPPDLDRDGVPDFRDKCPNTRTDKEIDSTGCPVLKIEAGARLTLDGIVFREGKAQIDEASRPTLESVALAILKAPDVHIEIAGYTDSRGSKSGNQRLSQSRANAVRIYLVSLGVPSRQLKAKGYGSADPVASNSTASGRARNRRIEFHVK